MRKMLAFKNFQASVIVGAIFETVQAQGAFYNLLQPTVSDDFHNQ